MSTKSLYVAVFAMMFTTLIAFALLISSVIQGCKSGAADLGDDYENNAYTHEFGVIWAEVVPASIGVELDADHTYVIAKTEQGTEYRWGMFGRDSDGTYLSESRSKNNVDLTVSKFMAEETPCAFPVVTYLQVGVCHQRANRALFWGGTTVAKARAYGIFSKIYGTYGTDLYGYGMGNCIDASPRIEVKRDTQKPENYVENTSAESIENKEIELYLRHYGTTGKAQSLNKSMDSGDSVRFRNYLVDLMLLQIRQNFGDDFSRDRIVGLVAAQSAALDGKDALDRQLMNGELTQPEFTSELNKVMNKMMDSFRSILTRGEYEQFAGLPFDESLDVGDYL